MTGPAHSGTAVLGIVHPSVTLRLVERLRSAAAAADPIILAPEIDRWRYEEHALAVWSVGEEHVELDSAEMTRRLLDANVREVVIPMGVPRRQLAFVARWMASTDSLRFTLQRGGLQVSGLFAAALLWLTTLFVRLPVSLGLRIARFADGVLIVTAARLLRAMPRRDAGFTGGVCHVVTHVGTGGAQRQLLEYLRWMAKTGRGDELSLVALFGGNRGFLAPLRATGIPVVVVEDRFDRTFVGRAVLAAFPTLSVIAGLARIVRGSRPRCLYGWLFIANVAAGIAGRTAGVRRIVASERTLSRWKAEKGTGRWWYRAADRAAAGLWDAVVANSDAAADDFALWAGIPRDAIRVIPNGFDFEALLSRPVRDIRALHGIRDDELLILTVGRLSPEKNHELLLRAAAKLPDAIVPFRVVLVGHGPLESGLRDRARELGIADRVVFAGRADDPESYYAAADLFVLTSRIESLPNALIEAQAFGVPAVTTDVGAAADVVVDGRTGVLVPNGSDDELARALGRLLSDAVQREVMGSAAERHVVDRFDVAAMATFMERTTNRRT